MAEERPTGATTILGGDKIGPTGTLFFIKVVTGDFDFWTKVEESSGDGDPAPTFEHNSWLYSQHVLQGWMIASKALGLATMIAAANPVAMTFQWGGTRKLTATVMVERLRVNWHRTGVFVGVSMLLRSTDAHPTEGSA